MNGMKWLFSLRRNGRYVCKDIVTGGRVHTTPALGSISLFSDLGKSTGEPWIMRSNEIQVATLPRRGSRPQSHSRSLSAEPVFLRTSIARQRHLHRKRN
jgi:hypothetical protein